jgi:hypothetical protein
MKKEILITILLITISLQLSAQRYKDALYLKNGSIVYGKLMEIADNKYKMQTSDGSLIIYPESDVDKLVKEIPAFQARRTEGLGMSLEAGLLLGAQNSEYDAPFSFNFIGNYAFKTKNILGIGSGVEFIGVPFVPLFMEYKYIVKDSKASPFFFARGGGLIHLADNDTEYDPYQYIKHDYRGGFSATIGTGISWAKDGFEPYLSFAYRYCSTSYKQNTYINGNNYYDYKYENNYNRLEVKFGFRF